MTKAQFDVFIHRLWIKVYHRWITNNFPCKWHTSTTSGSNPRPGRISTETPLEWERRLQNNEVQQRKKRRRRRQQETMKQKEHCLAQRKQRRQQETEEQEIGIRGIMIVHCRKPIPTDICTSKSAKFQLCFTVQTIIFRRTDICSLFLSFFKSGRWNNAKSAFQYTVNNKTT